MTPVEIVSKINDKNTKNEETNVAIGYDIVILINTGDIDGAVKYVQDYFQCDEETAKEAIEIRRRTLGKPLSPEQRAHNQAIAREWQNKPKCPTCSSTNVQKIGTGERAVSVAVLGIFSKKINKSFKCNNCGYTW
ncbi:MAG: hypothetical protein HDR11_03200 [Lachnospiraceae bacterium]|nr:hypothetical protein [Lachnospiraceae bacterium]